VADTRAETRADTRAETQAVTRAGQRPRSLRVKLSLCTGCRACTIVCALVHEQDLELNRARIHVEKNMPELGRPVFKPRFCRNCRNARCITACPLGVLREDAAGRVVVSDATACDGCGRCVTACPFDAIWVEPGAANPLKCDLCDDDPQCVRYCSVGALSFD
jgi:anaerobic carbon-monoxide dehydrogenase iron sulfur subunit